MRRFPDGCTHLLFCLFGLFVFAAPAIADVRVIDGDTIVLDGNSIRLEGIDAPELAQVCLNAAGQSYACGKIARDHLRGLIRSAKVRCEGSTKDTYGRRIATCFAGPKNLNKEMVGSGQAYAFMRYSNRYHSAQQHARRLDLGIWAGYSEAPWDFRKSKWQVTENTAPEGCPIKGNISKYGRIYHTPWSPHYNRTSINEAAGERWFCSEDEALDAGWRPPFS